MKNLSQHFNVRVYGICIENDKLLVSDELQGGDRITKLPGGGLEFGEGLADCLIREFKEELAADIVVNHLFYINDFVQISAFNPNSQVLAIYYEVMLLSRPKVNFSDIPFNFNSDENGTLAFRWIPLTLLTEEVMTFPIDKRVVRALLSR